MTTFTDARRAPRASATSRAGTFILSIDHETKTVAVAHNVQLLTLPERDQLRSFSDLFAYATGSDVEAALTAAFHTTFRADAGATADPELALAFREDYLVRISTVWHEPVTPAADAADDALCRLLAAAPAGTSTRVLASLSTRTAEGLRADGSASSLRIQQQPAT